MGGGASTPAVLDEEGNTIVDAVPETQVLLRSAGVQVVQKARAAGEDYAFRKEELLFLFPVQLLQNSRISKNAWRQ